MTAQVIVHLILVVAWALMTNDGSSINLLVGYIIGGIILIAVYKINGRSVYLRRLNAVIKLIGVFLWEQIKTNIAVARIVLSRNMVIRPAVVQVPLKPMSDGELTAVANMITLTPGTLSVHVSDDKQTLYVHMIHGGRAEEADLMASKTLFEKLVMGVTRG